MKSIELTRNCIALVDDDDFERVNSRLWCAAERSTSIYAVSRINNKIVYMHTYIMGDNHGLDTDHIDGDGLNNQKTNLRFVSHADNMQRSTKRKAGTSGYRGVWPAPMHNAPNVYVSWTGCGKTRKFLGRFKDAKNAALAYDRECRKRHGNLCYLNFPDILNYDGLDNMIIMAHRKAKHNLS